MVTLSRSAVLVGAFALLACGCDKSADTKSSPPVSTGYGTKLVGVWEGKEPGEEKDQPKPVTVEFTADGKCKFTDGKFEMPGTWKIAREGGHKMQVDVQFDAPGKKDAETTSFMADFRDEDTLVLSPLEKEKPIEFKRRK